MNVQLISAIEDEIENRNLCYNDKKKFQLTLVQKYKVDALKDAGHTQNLIAKTIGVSKFIVSRELSRNDCKRGISVKEYSASKAQNKMMPDIQ